MRVFIYTHLFCLLGAIPHPPAGHRIYSAAARSANSFEGDAKTPIQLAGMEQIARLL